MVALARPAEPDLRTSGARSLARSHTSESVRDERSEKRDARSADAEEIDAALTIL